MPINVTCPGCFTKFTVADKFAGQKGPCKKCKTIIEIPKLEDQVVIHAPNHSEAGAVGAGGRHALKTYKRQDTKVQPLMIAAVAGVVLVMLLVALMLRGQDKPTWLLALGAAILGPPLAWAGYSFLRDDELEGYTGTNLALRATACGLVYALLWGVYLFIGNQWFGSDSFAKGLEIWQMLVLAVPIGAMGTMAGYVSLDLDPGSSFFHWAMYFAVTVILRLVIGLAAIPGLGAS
jgi:cation transport ATPase